MTLIMRITLIITIILFVLFFHFNFINLIYIWSTYLVWFDKFLSFLKFKFRSWQIIAINLLFLKATFFCKFRYLLTFIIFQIFLIPLRFFNINIVIYGLSIRQNFVFKDLIQLVKVYINGCHLNLKFLKEFTNIRIMTIFTLLIFALKATIKIYLNITYFNCLNLLMTICSGFACLSKITTILIDRTCLIFVNNFI